MFIERQIQEIYPDKWDALNEIDKRFDVIEKKLGFPQSKRRLRSVFGELNLNTLVIEREWESLAALEAGLMKLMTDPELAVLLKETDAIVKSSKIEIYMMLP